MTDMPLSARLKIETRELHTLAERSGVMAELLHGRIKLPAYCALLESLRVIYAALEAGLEAHASDRNVQRLWHAGLRRLPSLEADLLCCRGVLRDTGAPIDTPPAGAALAYAERLAKLAAGEPALLLAHAYVRYLGDLHGGQVLGRLVRQRFDMAGPQGTGFYDFGAPADVTAMRLAFRAGLDTLQLSPAQVEAFVAEACSAFTRHQALFEELHASAPAPAAAAGLS